MLTKLDKPRSLDLSYNTLSDECLYPVVKYIFANHDCPLEVFSLENNRLSPYASRTLLKAQAISPNRDSIQFKYGPIPLGLENLRAGFINQFDQECIAAASPEFNEGVQDCQETKSNTANERGEVRLVIQRKSNNFSESNNALKRAPVASADQV